MLSERATKLVMGLSKVISGKEYVIYSWDEVAKCFDEKDVAIDEIKNVFEEVRLNQCINQKYKDDDEVCFALTDKALLIKNDYEVLEKAKVSKEQVIKTDEQGNSVIVIPKTENEIAPLTKSPKVIFNLGAFLWGILGGGLGGAIVCGIMLLAKLL
ncbi:MAG: hypothetical protein K5923_01710 [Clostridia bacterium]|nr:hypothetical protein [Clostridia bacterium]